MDRRRFVATAASLGTAAVTPSVLPAAAHAQPAPADGAADRAAWLARVDRIFLPVLRALAQGRLRATMPVETVPGATGREAVTHLEAVGRTLMGLAPWLALPASADAEGRTRAAAIDLIRAGLDHGTRPGGPDRLNFNEGSQPLVDAAFLAQAFLRAPAIWTGLPEATRTRLVDAFRSARVILPGFNNWLLFAATVEAFLKKAGDPTWDRMRVDYALRQHEQWYKGDGIYGDGPQFHFDYYNAFVIQPMLVDVLDACADDRPAWQAMREPVLTRARRFAAIQERLIAPDGSYPPVGRSLAYRCGAFQGLAQAALRKDLPGDVTPGQARAALSAVIARTLDAPGTVDAGGWLTLGLCGHQPGIAETYISTGSLYLCSAAFLPLGLPASDPFWTEPARAWTAKRAFAGEPIPIDKAIS
ncbi:hypothetical protein TBR22_A20250 [Luteitalea sp. TBR-22]|uniref:DUF2264 domain-containing protein n=1 Tax=Luteitalea sp. TBR-22 TaxID=2802971 RepID=UPI001AFAD845|nr:DUF2264 domain-containing protein [Luteitalea sp. TBR-22]BCS32802.1 hypothetical protein TBR22_A20250 [Luteitalea sp. TBR-22]